MKRKRKNSIAGWHRFRERAQGWHLQHVAGETLEMIAAREGVTKQAVSLGLRKWGFEIRSRRKIDEKALRAGLAMGADVKEMAALFGCTKSSIYSYIRRKGGRHGAF